MLTDWKKAYSTWLFVALALAGASLEALQFVSAEGVTIPAWVLPIVGAVGVFLRRLPQDMGQDDGG